MFANDVPTGSDPETVERYYEWLYEHYIERIGNAPGDAPNALSGAPEWAFQAWGPFLQVIVTAIVLISFFGVFAYRFNYVHRPRHMLYKPTFYDKIPERHGKAPLFSYAVYAAVAATAAYYSIEHILTGQVY